MAVRFIDRMMFSLVLTVSALTVFLSLAGPVAYGAQVCPAERVRAAAIYDMPECALDTIPEEDTVYALDEVMVVATRTSQEIVPVQMLSGEKLRTLGTHSIADAIRYFSGVQIKDYGGIGGLKTINVRSLGSQHVGVFYDGVELGNAQNGIVDLGRFSLDNMEGRQAQQLELRPKGRLFCNCQSVSAMGAQDIGPCIALGQYGIPLYIGPV